MNTSKEKVEVIDLRHDYAIIERFILRTDIIIEEQVVPLYDIEAVASIINSNIERYINYDLVKIIDSPKCDGIVKVIGDGMLPKFENGDVIAFKESKSRRGGLFFGHPYIVNFVLEGEEFSVLKYVYESEIPGHYQLVSINPKHLPVDIPLTCVRFMGIVKLLARRF